VTVVSLTTTTPVAATPPTVTDVAPVKYAPIIVIVVPPTVDPLDGLTPMISGATYVNAPTDVTVPFGVTTSTATTPAACAGVVAVTVVSLTTTTPVAATPPTVTDVAPVKYAPVIVIGVPPFGDPLDGLTPMITGAMYVNAFSDVAVPFDVTTSTATVPAACAGVVAVTIMSLITVTFVAKEPPTVNVINVPKFVPVITIDVPPFDDPLDGLTLLIVGKDAVVGESMVVIPAERKPSAAAAVPAKTRAVSTIKLTAANRIPEQLYRALCESSRCRGAAFLRRTADRVENLRLLALSLPRR
jgi:hypothetical protein